MRAPAGWYNDGAGYRRWWDGDAWTEWVDASAEVTRDSYTAPVSAAPPASRLEAQAEPSTPATPKRRTSAALVVATTLGAVLIAAVGVVLLAVNTAERWTKIDVAAQKETFRSEEYETGNYVVTDNGVSPCYVDQAWYECRNSMVAEYNRECVGRSIAAQSVAVCNSYGDEIDRMESVGEFDWVVESLGGFGYLQSTPETDSRQVSNNDYRAAITHEAVCYFGFVGECR